MPTSSFRAVLTLRLSHVPASIAGSVRVAVSAGLAGSDTSRTWTPCAGPRRFPGKKLPTYEQCSKLVDVIPPPRPE